MNNHNRKQITTAALAMGASLLFSPLSMGANDVIKLNPTDTNFIQEEASAGEAIVKMAELGETQAQNNEVKAFAKKLVAEHNNVNNSLTKLAKSKDVTLTSEPDTKQEDRQMTLVKATPAEFDKKFLTMVITNHEKCVKHFQHASEKSEDGDVKAWAAKTLPALQAHIVTAKKLTSETPEKEEASSNNPSATEADNTSRNIRDRDMNSLTPLDQGNSKEDIERTAQIRRAILDQTGLSTTAQKVKIITNDGDVTLRGPVDSPTEKNLIGEIANRIATSERTENQLEVRNLANAN